MEYIALDVHKKYTWARVENEKGDRLYESRLAHAHGTVKNFVSRWSARSPVAVETVGNWYWVVDEIEAGGGTPQLVNARLAKLMMGSVNKSDKLDCKGMNRLQEARRCRRCGSPPPRCAMPASWREPAWCSAAREPSLKTVCMPPWVSTVIR